MNVLILSAANYSSCTFFSRCNLHIWYMYCVSLVHMRTCISVLCSISPYRQQCCGERGNTGDMLCLLYVGESIQPGLEDLRCLRSTLSYMSCPNTHCSQGKQVVLITLFQYEACLGLFYVSELTIRQFQARFIT